MLRQITAPKTDSPNKILIFGNSLALHGPAPDIGWHGDWGMAASSAEKDFAHILAAKMADALGDIDCRVSQGAVWERGYHDETLLEREYRDAADFDADVVFIRIGENIPGGDMDEFPLAPYFAAMIRFLARKESSVAVVTDMFWRDPKKDDAVREAADSVGAKFVTIGDLGDDDENKAIGQFEHAGVAGHPSDAGMRRIAERLWEGWRENN